MARIESIESIGSIESETRARLGDDVVRRLAAKAAVSGARAGELLLARAALDLLAEKERLETFYGVIGEALEQTRPPGDYCGVWADYAGGIVAEPYSWLATLVAEALADYRPH